MMSSAMTLNLEPNGIERILYLMWSEKVNFGVKMKFWVSLGLVLGFRIVKQD